jgi:hypothetical protein
MQRVKKREGNVKLISIRKVFSKVIVTLFLTSDQPRLRTGAMLILKFLSAIICLLYT